MVASPISRAYVTKQEAIFWRLSLCKILNFELGNLIVYRTYSSFYRSTNQKKYWGFMKPKTKGNCSFFWMFGVLVVIIFGVFIVESRRGKVNEHVSIFG